MNIINGPGGIDTLPSGCNDRD